MSAPHSSDGDDARIIDAIRDANRNRLIASSHPAGESLLERRFGHSRRLAVYGSLAPGRQNHHIVAPLGGTWSHGRVRGDLRRSGWGAAIGYPGFAWREDGPWIAVQLLDAEGLEEAWSELDDFEGLEYRRILVPVYADDERIATVANIYELVPEPSAALPTATRFEHDDEVERLVAEFTAATLPHGRWTHRAHVAVAVWHTLRFGRDDALARMRDGIQRLNAAHGVAQTTTRGYHETLTRFYMWFVGERLARLDRGAPLHTLANEIVAECDDRTIPLRYWTQERLMSWDARTRWVEPDRRPFPIAPPDAEAPVI